jgi:hypothetical protein
MNYRPYYLRNWRSRARRAGVVFLAVLAGAATGRAQIDTGSDVASLDQPDFSLKYPATWKVDSTAHDYDPKSNFTLNSPKNSYVQFRIFDKSESPLKILNATVTSLDGPAISSVSQTKFREWGHFDGLGLDLKGKILDSFPGGIRIFVFSTKTHNILITEYYFTDELREMQSAIQLISNSFEVND